jgi:hypothetical protein
MSIGILVVAPIQPRMLHSLWSDSIIFDKHRTNSEIKKKSRYICSSTKAVSQIQRCDGFKAQFVKIESRRALPIKGPEWTPHLIKDIYLQLC